LDFFEITPEYNLDIMKSNQTLNTITSDILNLLDPVIKKEMPDLVLVHGDTTTAFSAALCAFYNKITVGHVEAGLRSYDRLSPYPEEMNRRLVGSIAELHFIPTPLCREQLLKENINTGLYITGNTEIDATRYTVKPNYQLLPPLCNLDFTKRILFVTAHRRENLGEPLQNICKALLKLANEFDDIQIVYLVHLNPAVRETVFSILAGHKNIVLTDPVPPVDAHNLIAKSYLILTDSGGIQEDAPALHKPVLVLRRETERPEGVEAGTAKLAGTNTDTIYEMAKNLLNNKEEYTKMAEAKNPYGDGHSSERICEAILHFFGKGEAPADYL